MEQKIDLGLYSETMGKSPVHHGTRGFAAPQSLQESPLRPQTWNQASELLQDD